MAGGITGGVTGITGGLLALCLAAGLSGCAGVPAPGGGTLLGAFGPAGHHPPRRARTTSGAVASTAAQAAAQAPAQAPGAAAARRPLIVPATAMPWLWKAGGLNAAYRFGYPNGTPPVAVPLDALGAAPGGVVTIAYLGGHIAIGEGAPPADGNGYAGLYDHGAPGALGPFPSAYMRPYPINLGALVGCFTDAAGRIEGQPFAIGAVKTSRAVPPGATRLQLGINDDVFGGNTPATRNSGGFSVAVAAGPGS